MSLNRYYLTFWVAFLFYFNLQAADNSKLIDYEERQDKAFQLIFSDPQSAKKAIDKLIIESLDFPDSLISSTYNVLGVYYAVKNENDSALIAFDKAASLLTSAHKALPLLYFNMAVLQKKIGNYYKSFELLDEAFALVVELNDSVQMAKIYGEKASVHKDLEEYNLAVQSLMKSIEILKSLEKRPTKVTMIEKQKLANLYNILGNHEFAEELYLKVIPFFKDNQLLDSYYITLINYSDCLMNMGKLPEAEKFLKETIAEIGQFENEEWIIYANDRYARLKVLQNNPNAAFEFYRKAFEMAVATQSSRTVQIATDFIRFLLETHQNVWIDSIINSVSIELASKGTFTQQIDFLLAKSMYYEAIENYKKGLENLRAVWSIVDSTQHLKDYAEARELQAKYQNEIKQQENLILQQKISLQKRMYAILSLSLVFLLAVGIYSYNVLRLKNRNNQFQLQVAKTNRQLSEQKLAAETALRELKEQDLENQRKELIEVTMEKIELNNRLEKILEKIEQGENSGLKKEIVNLKISNDFWEPLLRKFNELNPDFQSELKAKYPDLTRSEVEFCTLIKLNMTFKEIAGIMQISHSSVITKKYRLTKKLGIDAEIDIYEFFKN